MSCDYELADECVHMCVCEQEKLQLYIRLRSHLGLLTIVKMGITIVSYFGNVTASLFALTTFGPLHNGLLGDGRKWPLWRGGRYGEVGV